MGVSGGYQTVETTDLFGFFRWLAWFDRSALFASTWQILSDGGVSFGGETNTLLRPPVLNLFDGQNCRLTLPFEDAKQPTGYLFVEAPLDGVFESEPVPTLSGELLYKRLSVLDLHHGTVLRRKPNQKLGIQDSIIRFEERLIVESDDRKILAAVERLRRVLQEPPKVLRQHRPEENSPYAIQLYSPNGGDWVMLLREIMRILPDMVVPYRWNAVALDPVQGSRRNIPLDHSYLVEPRAFDSITWDGLLKIAALYPAEGMYDEDVIERLLPGEESEPDLRMTFDFDASIETNDDAIVKALHGMEFRTPVISELD